jgi:hypothetical protein
VTVFGCNVASVQDLTDPGLIVGTSLNSPIPGSAPVFEPCRNSTMIEEVDHIDMFSDAYRFEDLNS